MSQRKCRCRPKIVQQADTIPLRTEWDDMGAAISHLRSHLESLEGWYPDISVDFTITLTRKGRKE